MVSFKVISEDEIVLSLYSFLFSENVNTQPTWSTQGSLEHRKKIMLLVGLSSQQYHPLCKCQAELTQKTLPSFALQEFKSLSVIPTAAYCAKANF